MVLEVKTNPKPRKNNPHMQVLISKSKIQVSIQTLVIGFIGFLLLLLSGQILRAVDAAISYDMSGFLWGFRIFALILVALAVLVTWYADKKHRYFLDANTLMIDRSYPGGTHVKKVYATKDIVSVDLQQSYLGRKYDFGTITIRLQDKATTEVISMKNVEHPREVLNHLRSKL